MKKLVVLLIAFAVIFSGISGAFAGTVDRNAAQVENDVYVNGVRINSGSTIVAVSGRILIPALTALQGLNVAVNWNSDEEVVSITKGDTVIKMKIGEKKFSVNDEYRTMDVSPIIYNGIVMVPIRFVALALNVDVIWNTEYNAVIVGREPQDMATSRGDYRKFVVVIDPGHGGSETGAISGGVMEKDINLAMAEKLNVLLKSAGIKTYMTRTDDTYVGLYDRSGLANDVKADLLISIHNNAGYSKTIGSMSLYYPSSSKSKGNLSPLDFANIVQDQLTGTLGQEDLGVIERPHLAVLRTSNMPSVIAEVGFMTNPTELKKLLTDSFQQKTAAALKNAVLAALKKI